MTLFDRLDRWQAQSKITVPQHQTLVALARREPFSVFLELNVLLYLGVLSFVGGLGWTIQTYAKELGAVAILIGLTSLLAACLLYCFLRGAPYVSTETVSSNLVFDYVLYLGCLCWSVELGYLETHFHLMGTQWDLYLLMTSLLFFALAYRFDNRFVLSMALSTLAAWFGVKVSHYVLNDPLGYRTDAILYGLVVLGTGAALAAAGIKRHFSGTYFNFAANVLFIAILSGIFSDGGFSLWTMALVASGAISLFYGIRTRQFVYVAYAVVYGYVGLSWLLLRNVHEFTFILLYLVGSGVAMVTGLTILARRFGRDA